MSSSESDTDDIPDREVCEQLCQEFAQITDTDSACAMFFLQNHKWILEPALNAYFETNPAKEASKTEKKDDKAKPAAEAQPTDPEPHRIRIMSWNIDGLDTNNIRNRTKGVCATINREKPDVVYLQEVVPTSLELLEEGCPTYQVVPAGGEGYFTAMMLRVSSVKFDDHAITPFYTSKMARNLLQVKASVKDVPVMLMTSHLESTAAHAAERKRQLQASLKAMRETDKQCTVLFGGDLNLRDKEVAEIGGLPDGIVDLWEVTGKRPEAKFTWDLTRNDNLDWDRPFRPKCRFDRMLLLNATPKAVKPVYFELIGLEKLASCRRFCSDHWGILAHFDKTGD